MPDHLVSEPLMWYKLAWGKCRFVDTCGLQRKSVFFSSCCGCEDAATAAGSPCKKRDTESGSIGESHGKESREKPPHSSRFSLWNVLGPLMYSESQLIRGIIFLCRHVIQMRCTQQDLFPRLLPSIPCTLVFLRLGREKCLVQFGSSSVALHACGGMRTLKTKKSTFC